MATGSAREHGRVALPGKIALAVAVVVVTTIIHDSMQ
jgi:hypothetical protein